MTIMREYTQYRFEDFFQKHYYQGGLHIFQVHRLYDFIIGEKNDLYRFHAAIHGIDLDKNKNKEELPQSTESNLEEQQKKQELPLFQDPSKYENMSPEEREKLTNQMMSQHKNWVEKGSPTVGK